MICNYGRSSILAPNDLDDAETFLDLASNGNNIWLPFKYVDVENYDMGYWKNYKSDQMANFLHFALNKIATNKSGIIVNMKKCTKF